MNDERQDMTLLIDAYLDGTITPGQLAELEAWLEASPENARAFAELSLLERGLHESGRAGASADALDKVNKELASRGDEDIIEAEPIPVAKLAPAREYESTQRARGGRGIGVIFRYAAAAVFLIVAGLAFSLLWTPASTDEVVDAGTGAESGAVATLTSTSGAEWESGAGDFLSAGAALERERLRLRSGSAEVLMRSTATVTLLGPAEIQMLGPNRCRLDRGRLLANVPPAAHGFAVETPAGEIVDLGTVFSVEVDTKGWTTVRVLRGSVDAKLADAVIGTRLAAGEGIRLNAELRRATPVALDAEAIAAFFPMPTGLRHTGQGLTNGQPDPNWRVVSRSDVTGFTPDAAVVSNRVTIQRGDASNWITSRDRRSVPPHVEMTFATTFEVSREQVDRRFGVRVVADNQLAAVRLNGEPVPLDPQHTPMNTQTHTLQRLGAVIPVESGLVVGANTLEIVVRNGPAAPADVSPNPIGLRAEFVPLLP